MLFKKLLLLFLTGVFLTSFCPQKTQLVLRLRHDQFTADNIGNIYLVKGEELSKYSPSGKFLVRYSNLKLGDITTIDVTNPLKILLYYRDFQQVVFLDNQLSLNSEAVSLEKLGYEQTDLVCAGSNNSFWIYNKQNNELVRFNEQAKKIVSTGNIKQVLDASISPAGMKEHNGYLYLNSPAHGIFVFDIFGAFSRIIAIRGLRDFDVDEEVIYYQKDSSLCSYQHKLFEEKCKVLSARPTSLKYLNRRLYASYRDSVLVQEL
jgi:hypothetical protein